MSSRFDKNLLPDFEAVKDKGEKILWMDKPKFVPFILTGLGIGFFTILFGAAWIAGTLLFKSDSAGGDFFEKNKWLIGLIPLGQGLYVLVNRWLSYSNTAYAFSNKRVMIRSGFVGTDFKMIDYDKIADMEVSVNMVERMFNVGTVRFFTGSFERTDDYTQKMYDNWFCISNPYEIFKQVKQTSIDIKTDLTFPNALRPVVNPGYNTQYQREN